jgi:uncharacterized iron-regulated membrane protein
MELPTTLSPSEPWRAAALVAGAIASVELFILIVLGVAFVGRLTADEVKRVTTPIAAQSPSAPTEEQSAPGQGKAAPAPDLRPRNETSVIVLNGNGIQGAAGIAADRVRRQHYIIAGTGNAPRHDFAHSVVMYRPGFEGEAKRLGRDLHVKRVVPLDGLRVRDLQGAHLAFIVGG